MAEKNNKYVKVFGKDNYQILKTALDCKTTTQEDLISILMVYSADIKFDDSDLIKILEVELFIDELENYFISFDKLIDYINLDTTEKKQMQLRYRTISVAMYVIGESTFNYCTKSRRITDDFAMTRLDTKSDYFPLVYNILYSNRKKKGKSTSMSNLCIRRVAVCIVAFLEYVALIQKKI